jgi:hypothetical protein
MQEKGSEADRFHVSHPNEQEKLTQNKLQAVQKRLDANCHGSTSSP